MYKFIAFLLLNTIFYTSFSIEKGFIRNRQLPICTNCLHFIEHTNNYPYDPIPSDFQYGRCKKFGEVNLITGVIDYDLARNCRFNSSKCGNCGAEYEKKNNIILDNID